MDRRVVITGLGAVSPIGIGKENYWRALEKGTSGIGKITAFDTANYNVKIAAEVKGFDPAVYMPKKDAKRSDPAIRYAVAAATMAVEDAKLDVASLDPWRFGVYIGSGQGGFKTLCDSQTTLNEKGPGRVSPFAIPMMINNMSSANVAIKFGAKGPNMSIVTACATSINSIGEAWHCVRRGDSDVMLTGGTEACVLGLSVAGFASMKALSSSHNDDPERASRPFDKDRDGFVIGEGSGVIVIEELEHALARGAHIYAEITGYGATCDAGHITAPDPEGLGAAKAMEAALRLSGWESVDLINAHGTSTHLNDLMESKAINAIFGDKTPGILVNSTKSIIGHCLGAAGALETIAAVQSIEEGIVHKTLNYDTPDPDCAVNVVAETLYDRKIERTLVNNFGFGGHNGVLAVGKYKA